MNALEHDPQLAERLEREVRLVMLWSFIAISAPLYIDALLTIFRGQLDIASLAANIVLFALCVGLIWLFFKGPSPVLTMIAGGMAFAVGYGLLLAFGFHLIAGTVFLYIYFYVIFTLSSTIFLVGWSERL
jgi:hypothetical protein